MELARLKLIFFLSFAALIPCLSADIAEDDEVWRRQAAEAMEVTDQHYEPNPGAVVSHFNMKAQEFASSIDSRRGLSQSSGSCDAANPIDKCWRCRQDWAENRQALADCGLGFGKGTTGGKGGEIYEVTDPSDSDTAKPKVGTLRHAVTQNGPLWITFAKDMNIKLQQEMLVTSDKTIDGRGANVHIAGGAGIMMQNVKNVIIHGIHIHDISPQQGGMIMVAADQVQKRGESDGDAIGIFTSSKIWIDHCSLSKAYDGLIDAIQGSTAITISNCHLSDHDKAILLGATDDYTEDKKLQATLAFNRFGKEITQRLPAIRFGFAHVVNNDYIHWKMYAIGGLKGPTILSQGNRFLALDNANTKEVTKRMAEPNEWKNWIWRSEGDLFLNGAYFNQSGDPKASIGYDMTNAIKPLPGTEVEKLTKSAGVLICKAGQIC